MTVTKFDCKNTKKTEITGRNHLFINNSNCKQNPNPGKFPPKLNFIARIDKNCNSTKNYPILTFQRPNFV